MELLSDEAGTLYAHLVTAGGLPIGEEPGRVCRSDPALEELCRHGLAWASPDGLVHPVAPDLALGKLLVRRQREMVARHNVLLEDYQRLAKLAKANGQPAPADSPHVEVLTSTARVTTAISQMQAGPVANYRAVEVPWLGPPTQHADALRRRIISTPRFLDDAPPSATEAWRIAPVVPMRMLVADGVGLVLLTPCGIELAALVRAPIMVDALAHYFDLLWDQAVPIGSSASATDIAEPLPRFERTILGLLMAGLTDAAIARCLRVSARSVRRHVAALEERAGVTTRFALGAASVRLGWVGTEPVAG